MRTICDACESAAAVVFCAADQASLCRSCDDKVHTCNKLASRHVRVGLADPNEVPHCDICENAPAFFYCEIDGSSLCLQCDMAVHVGSKRSHERYLLFKQRVEFPGDKTAQTEDLTIGQGKNKVGRNQLPKPTSEENQEIHKNSMRGTAFDLNVKPQRTHGEASNHQRCAIRPV